MIRRLMWNAAVIAGVGATVALASCGGGDSGGSGRATAVPGVPDGSALIDQKNLKFAPTKLTVGATEQVYFRNGETTLHTVTINGKNESGTMKRDAIFTWTPPAPGEYKIGCEFHPQMKSTLTVE